MRNMIGHDFFYSWFMIGNDSWTFFSNFSISVWFSENLNDNHDMSYPSVTVTERWETVRVFHISVHFPHIWFEDFHDMYGSRYFFFVNVMMLRKCAQTLCNHWNNTSVVQAADCLLQKTLDLRLWGISKTEDPKASTGTFINMLCKTNIYGFGVPQWEKPEFPAYLTSVCTCNPWAILAMVKSGSFGLQVLHFDARTKLCHVGTCKNHTFFDSQVRLPDMCCSCFSTCDAGEPPNTLECCKIYFPKNNIEPY